MGNDTILVLADPSEPQLAMLQMQLAAVKTVAGDSVEAFEHAAADASVLFNWSGSLALFREGFGICPNLRRMVRNQQARVWEAFDVMPISGQTVGIIGYGDIGRAIAARVRPMGMRVLAVKRNASPLTGADPMVEQIYRPEQRIEMISRCDYVIVAAPLTSETRGMIGEQE